MPRNENRSRAPLTSTWRVPHRRQPERPVDRSRTRRCRRGSASSRAAARPSASTFSRGRPGRREIGRGPPADRRQRLGEADQAVVFRLVADFAPLRVIAVLLPPARIAAGRLEVAARVRSRSRRPSTPAESRARGSARAPAAFLTVPALRANVTKPRAGAHPPDAGPGIVRVLQTRHACGGGWIGRDLWRCATIYGPLRMGQRLRCVRIGMPRRGTSHELPVLRIPAGVSVTLADAVREGAPGADRKSRIAAISVDGASGGTAGPPRESRRAPGRPSHGQRSGTGFAHISIHSIP